MKRIVTLVLASIVALAAGAASADEIGNLGCKIPASAFKSNGKGGQVAFFISNTNSGKGNGSELVAAGEFLGADFALCLAGLPGDDNNTQLGSGLNHNQKM